MGAIAALAAAAICAAAGTACAGSGPATSSNSRPSRTAQPTSVPSSQPPVTSEQASTSGQASATSAPAGAPPCAATYMPSGRGIDVHVVTPGPAVVQVVAPGANGPGQPGPSATASVPSGDSAVNVDVAGTAPPEAVDVTVNANHSVSTCRAAKA